MYDELVKRLREPGKWIDAKEHYSLLKQAADAIEELTDIINGEWLPISERFPDEPPKEE